MSKRAKLCQPMVLHHQNHVAATAAACHLLGIVIYRIHKRRELGWIFKKTLRQNKTLKNSAPAGMQLHFCSRKIKKMRTNAARIAGSIWHLL
jgi:1-aminocyclopropane-1-carboxylate deaminase/D-cysteine desulfhydrase-like pyridoxal-dependent ACC family enzyme